MNCWCFHPERDHIGGVCRSCAVLWPHIMQPGHRWQPIDDLPVMMRVRAHDARQGEVELAMENSQRRGGTW